MIDLRDATKLPFSALRAVYRWNAAKNNNVFDHYERVTYTVALDTHALHAMARRAAASKGKKSTDGPLTVKVIKQEVQL